MIAWVIFLYLVVALIEITPLILKRQIKELWFCSSMISFAFLVTLLLCIGIEFRGYDGSIKQFVFAVIGR